jgi:hypothetical protein
MSNSALVFALSALKKANTANERIDNLPLPMVFKGTLGAGGTISTLPTASSENEGFVYIVITDGTYAGQTAKAGDTFVSDGSAWVLVPSADEPSVIDDTVTSMALTWSSDKISKISLKKYTYTGTGEVPNAITFPDTPELIIAIQGRYGKTANYGVNNSVDPIIWGASAYGVERPVYANTTEGNASPAGWCFGISYEGNTMTLTGNAPTGVFNTADIEYTVYYF